MLIPEEHTYASATAKSARRI
ncbi:hypothetical protein RSAG8_07321, partial [Rhizoctonia solani AG-8 WAC10335]